VGFIAYQLLDGLTARIFLECEDEGLGVSYTHAVDVHFSAGEHGCRLSGVDTILALKKFYKLVFSLEERAREHGGDWRAVFNSADKLIEHLDYTRNVRRLDPQAVLRIRRATPDAGILQE
jgi:hypothetical protein